MNRLPVLDFARSAADARKFRSLAMAIFGVLLGVELGLLGWQFQEIEGARASLVAEQMRLKKPLKQMPDGGLSKEFNLRLAAARNMVNSLGIRWEGLFAALEAAHQGKVIVESIRPDVNGRVEIGALAADFSEITGFIERLSAAGTLQQVVLLAETPSLDAKRSIRFVVTAAWREVH